MYNAIEKQIGLGFFFFPPYHEGTLSSVVMRDMFLQVLSRHGDFNVIRNLLRKYLKERLIFKTGFSKMTSCSLTYMTSRNLYL